MASRNTLDMTEGPILKKLLLFAYPLMLNMLISTLYGTIDKIVAGRFINDAAMAAVGASEPPLNMLINFFVAMGVGVSVVCGSHVGGRRQKELRQCMHTAPLTGLLCGIVVCLLGLLTSKALLNMTNVPQDVIGGANKYMVVRILGTPVFLASTFCSSIFTSHGDTKRITFIGIFSGLFNVVGNLIFVLVFRMGVEALALATVLAETIAFAMKLFILFSPKDVYGLKLAELRIDGRQCKDIFAIGLPNAFRSILFSASNVIVQSGINSLGTDVLAGNSAADTVMQYVFLFPGQMASACACAAAQCYGAAKYGRIRKVTLVGILSSAVLLVAASIPITIFRIPLLRLFTETDGVARAGVANLLISCWGYLLYIVGNICTSSLQGMHKTLLPVVVNTVTTCAPRVLWTLFVFPLFGSPASLYAVYPISWGLSSIFIAVVYLHAVRKLESTHAVEHERWV